MSQMERKGPRRNKPRRRTQAPRGPQPAPPTDWGHVAQWYDQLVGDAGSEYQREVVLPNTLRLMAMQPGQRALDVACGQGVLCRLLHEQKVEVTGVDAAGELIRLARERSEAGIRYIKADARELSALLTAEHYHAAACVLAIQNIDPLGAVMAGVSRALAAGGRFVIVMMHPCFRSPKATAWGWDAEARVQYRRVDRYLLPRKEPIVTHPGKDPHRYTWTFHRPIQAYVRALRQAGLLVDAIEEWTSHKQSEPGPRAAAENQSRKEIPLFLAIRAVKVNLPAPAATPAP